MPPAAAAETVEGVVERVLYRSEDDDFTVLLVRVERRPDLVKAAGPVGEVAEGQTWRFAGEPEDHPKYGARLKIVAAYPVTPSSVEGLRRYLAAGRFPGVGERVASHLVDAYGTRAFDVLAGDQPLKIPGLGKKRAVELRAAIRKDRVRCETLAFLAGLGLGPTVAVRVHRRFGDETTSTVRKNPYVLADEVRGVGFLTADAVAASLGIRGDDPHRLRAGLVYSLRQAADQGHSALPVARLTTAAARLLEADEAVVSGALDAAAAEGRLTVDDAGGDAPFAYLVFLHAAELEAAGSVLRFVGRTPLLAADGRAAPPLPDFLSDEQRAAVELLLRRPIALLTGGPGVGKTTVLKAWVGAAEALGKSVRLAAPTGRAARRMEEATERPASTLHRLLGIIPSDIGGPQPPIEPIECDALAVDETSMLDLVLFTHLLRALPPHASLVLVGDPDQLPSVGPGDVMNALIRSGVAPVARLTRIFRQDSAGLLVTNAHRVLAGRPPETPAAGALADYYFMERATPEEGAELVRELVVERLPKRFGFDPREDIQTLCPMHRGAHGTENLNAVLQQALNGAEPAFRRGNRLFHRGDRVIALRNDYVRFVANGEVGRVIRADDETATLEVAFSGKVHVYRGAEADELSPAFALTVHKAQGSEYPAVVLPLFTEHFPMLRRAVLYTAMTRAKKLLVVVGQKRALAAAVADARRSERFGLLARRLGACDDATES
jgi:exodeoxyribonuclease V alpha subunit